MGMGLKPVRVQTLILFSHTVTFNLFRNKDDQLDLNTVDFNKISLILLKCVTASGHFGSWKVIMFSKEEEKHFVRRVNSRNMCSHRRSPRMFSS